MASTLERISIVETKVGNLNEKLDVIKDDVKEMNTNMEKTRDEISNQLNTMYEASCTQHAELAKKINGLEQAKQKITWMVAGAVAFSGIVIGHLDKISAFFK
jgi:chromosome segregation ATPase